MGKGWLSKGEEVAMPVARGQGDACLARVQDELRTRTAERDRYRQALVDARHAGQWSLAIEIICRALDKEP